MGYLYYLKRFVFVLCILFVVSSCKNDDDNINRPTTPKWQTQSGNTNQDLTAVKFLDNGFGIACGAFGTLLKTDDGGKNWQNLTVGDKTSFVSIEIINPNQFYVGRITLYKTEDAGNTFIKDPYFNSSPTSISDIYFYNDSIGILSRGGTVYFTKNGGNNWIESYTQFGYARHLEITTNSTAFLAGGRTFDRKNDGELHKSVDNGESWTELTLPIEIDSSQITAIDFLSHQVGFVSTISRVIFKTTDGGISWQKITPLTSGFVTDLLFLSELEGYYISGSKVYYSTNGGNTWKFDYEELNQATLTSITAGSSGTIYAVGNNGTILKKR